MLRHKWFCPPFNFFDEGIEQDGWAARLKLLQLGVFGFGGDENGNVGVGVFPQRKEILIGPSVVSSFFQGSHSFLAGFQKCSRSVTLDSRNARK